MHSAKLYNYLGLPEITGTEFQQMAREQYSAGAKIQDRQVTASRKRAGFA
jgi:hypothetical protein